MTEALGSGLMVAATVLLGVDSFGSLAAVAALPSGVAGARMSSRLVLPDSSGECTTRVSNVLLVYLRDLDIAELKSTTTISPSASGAISLATEQQFLRSSWSGPRGYSSWANSGTSDGFGSVSQQEVWVAVCPQSGGYYDDAQQAYPVVNGVYYSNAAVASASWLDNQLCGTTS
jgi:hypothetical protein